MNKSPRKEPLVPLDQTVEGGLAVTLSQKLFCWCGAPLPNQSSRGRKRLFCCPAHKQREYRNRLEEKRNNTNILYSANALSVLKTIDDNSVDCLVTDPPYGYSFMGKDWDKAVPSVEIWKECIRVLKPGAFAFVMSAPRSDVQFQMIGRLLEAGFRMDFSPIYWAYASGFPKATNIGKMVDKRKGVSRVIVGDGKRHNSKSFGGNIYGDYEGGVPMETKGNSSLEGSYGGFQPKPAVEVILVCMKPLSEKTFVDQALNNGKGITWLDDCRIPYEVEDTPKPRLLGRSEFFGVEPGVVNPQGRFPANLLVSDDALNNGKITKSPHGIANRQPHKGRTWNSENSGLREKPSLLAGYGDSGSFSRYFDLDKWFEKKLEELPASVRKTFPFLHVPKASKSEKNTGLNDISNTHPTVKPLKLMSYLITLGSRQGDCILDPFMGSGTTCAAASQLGRRYIGIELNEEYVNIAQKRLKTAS